MELLKSKYNGVMKALMCLPQWAEPLVIVVCSYVCCNVTIIFYDNHTRQIFDLKVFFQFMP